MDGWINKYMDKWMDEFSISLLRFKLLKKTIVEKHQYTVFYSITETLLFISWIYFSIFL